MKRAAIFAGIAALWPAVAWADPVTAVAYVAQAVTGSALVATAVVVGGNIYRGVQARKSARRAAARQRARFNASLQDRTITALRSDPPWQIVYGRCVVGGFPLDIFATDKTGTKTDGTTYTKADGYQNIVLALASHEVEEIGEVYIDGVAVGALDADGWATGGEFATSRTVQREITIGAGASSVQASAVTVLSAWDETLSNTGGDGVALTAGTYTLTDGSTTINNTGANPLRVTFTLSETQSRVRVVPFLGASNQTTPSVLTELDSTRYTSAYRFRGIAGIVVTLDLDEPRFQAGLPNITADVTGHNGITDVRDGSVGWTDNAALVAAHFLSAEWGFGVDLDDTDEVNRDALIAAANACDETATFTVDGASTTGARYTINGSFRCEGEFREAVLADLEEAMAGFIAPSAGWVIQAGVWTPAVMELDDDDLAGLVDVVQADTPTDELFNGVRGQLQLDGALSPSDFNTYQNATFAEADGESLWSDIALPFTNSLPRARNICRILVERNRSGQVIRYPAKIRAWTLQVGDRVRVTHAELGLVEKHYRVTDTQLGGEVPVLLTLQEDAQTIYDDADEATADPTPNTALPSPWFVTAPAGVAVVSGATSGVSDGTIDSRARVTWNNPTDAYMASPNARAIVRWRRQLKDAANVWQEALVPATDRYAFIRGVRPNDAITASVQFRNPLGALSAEVFVHHVVTGNGGTTTDVYTASESTGGIVFAETVQAEIEYTPTANCTIELTAFWRVELNTSYNDPYGMRVVVADSGGSVLQSSPWVSLPQGAASGDYAAQTAFTTYVATAGVALKLRLTGKTSLAPRIATLADIELKAVVIKR